MSREPSPRIGHDPVAIEQARNVSRTIIEPPRRFVPLDLGELVRHRELLWFLAWRDVKVRYKQTLLGVSWVVLQPLATMTIFTVFFGRLAKLDTGGVPYPLFSFAGLLIWLYFANAVSGASNSLVVNVNLITKVYFPRLFVPVGATLAGIVDYSISILLLVGMMFLYDVTPDVELLALPLVLGIAFVTATGFGMLLAALNVEYRDVRYATPFLIQLWLFVSPVIWDLSTVGASGYRWLLALNPMCGIVDAHRAAILPERAIDWTLLGVSGLVSGAVFVASAFYFKKMERSFADVI
jgi:lipopolysaccharide transport system permease protein